MPIFICEGCNETLKRNKVSQHQWSCKRSWVLSCMDCNKRFEGEAYLQHTTCMSEAERYQGHLYVHKENKGELKQQAWLGAVQAKLDASGSCPAQLRPFVQRLLAYDNVPRKRAKFVNFAKNSLNLKQDRDGIAEKLWELIETAQAQPEGAAGGAASGGDSVDAAASGADAPRAGTEAARTPASDAVEGKRNVSIDAATSGKDVGGKADATAHDKEARKAEKKVEKAQAKAEAKALKAQAKAAKGVAQDGRRGALCLVPPQRSRSAQPTPYPNPGKEPSPSVAISPAGSGAEKKRKADGEATDGDGTSHRLPCPRPRPRPHCHPAWLLFTEQERNGQRWRQRKLSYQASLSSGRSSSARSYRAVVAR